MLQRSFLELLCTVHQEKQQVLDGYQATFIWAEKSVLMDTEEGVHRPDGVAVFHNTGVAAKSPSLERVPVVAFRHRKLRDRSEGKEVGWEERASFHHYTTT